MNLHIAGSNVTGWVLGVAGTVATGLVAALVVATVATAAGSSDGPTRHVGGDVEHGTRITTACHITPNTWNVSADGPMWRCYRYLP